MSNKLTKSAEDYLRSVGGLSAHGGFRVKAAVLRGMIQRHDRRRLNDALPGSLHPLTSPSLPATIWVSEVQATVIYLTCLDVFFDSDEAFLADILERNRQVLDSRLYRGLTKFFTPGRIAKMGSMVFNTLHHDGLRMVSADGTPFLWELRYAPYLVPEILGRCYATAIVAAMKSAGHATTSEVVSYGPRKTLIQVSLVS